MAAMKYEIEKFTGKNDFGLWRIKMRAILIQQGLAHVIEPAKLITEGEDKAKIAETQRKAHSAIILCLEDKVLREVAKEKDAASVWSKLESLYMTKSLENRLYMKQRLYAYKLVEDRSMEDQLEEFNKAIDDLENIDVTIDSTHIY